MIFGSKSDSNGCSNVNRTLNIWFWLRNLIQNQYSALTRNQTFNWNHPCFAHVNDGCAFRSSYIYTTRGFDVSVFLAPINILCIYTYTCDLLDWFFISIVDDLLHVCCFRALIPLRTCAINRINILESAIQTKFCFVLKLRNVWVDLFPEECYDDENMRTRQNRPKKVNLSRKKANSPGVKMCGRFRNWLDVLCVCVKSCIFISKSLLCS